MTCTARVHVVGGTVAEVENPNRTAAPEGVTSTFTPIAPVPRVYGPTGVRFHWIELTAPAMGWVVAVATALAGPIPSAFSANARNS
jgi:hypothetical protein